MLLKSRRQYMPRLIQISLDQPRKQKHIIVSIRITNLQYGTSDLKHDPDLTIRCAYRINYNRHPYYPYRMNRYHQGFSIKKFIF